MSKSVVMEEYQMAEFSVDALCQQPWSLRCSIFHLTVHTAPFVIVADDAFPLKKYLIKPFGSKNLSVRQQIYNYRLCGARRVMENAFGIMYKWFRILKKNIRLSPAKLHNVVMAVCCLHNFLLHNARSSSQYLLDDPDLACDLKSVSRQQGIKWCPVASRCTL